MNRSIFFKITSKISSTNELSSVCYFHALLRTRHNEEAIREIQRFYSVGKPEEYERILEDFREAAQNSNTTKTFLESVERASGEI